MNPIHRFYMDIAAGFAVGVAFGYGAILNKHEEARDSINLLESICSEKEIEEQGFTKERQKKVKRRATMINCSYPIAISGVYNAIQCALYLSLECDSSIPSAFGAYTGTLVGAAVKHFTKDKKRKKEEAIFKKLLEGDDCIENYIPKDKKEAVKKELEKLEILLLSKEDVERKEFDPYIKPIYETLATSKEIYGPLMIEWGKTQCTNVIENVFVQRKLIDFYEENLPTTCGIMGKPISQRARVFIKEGNEYFIQEMEWNSIEISQEDETHVGKAKLIIGKKEKVELNGNYRQIAKRILQLRNYESIILMNAPLNMPEENKAMAISTFFIPEYCKNNKN